MRDPMDKLEILILEDVDDDAKLVERALRSGGLEFSALRVETREDFLHALVEIRPDVILADCRLPYFDGRTALKLARERLPATPVIIVTGTMVDEAAVELLREGAADYILKDRLSRLAPAVRRALDEAAAVAAKLQAEMKYRSLFELARDGIVLVHADTAGIVDCNPEFEAQSGYTLERLRESVFWDLVPAERVAAARAKFEHARAAGVEGNELFELKRPDASVLPIEFCARAIELGGKHYLLAQVRDVSERLEAEARLHAQIDELRRFKNVTVDRELRMQELEERIAALTAATTGAT